MNKKRQISVFIDDELLPVIDEVKKDIDKQRKAMNLDPSRGFGEAIRKLLRDGALNFQQNKAQSRH